MGRAEPWDEYAERHQNGWTRDEYEKEYEAVERAMAGEDDDGRPYRIFMGIDWGAGQNHNDDGLGALRGMWFLVRLMLTVGLFVVLCFDVAAHWNAGRGWLGFVQFAAWGGFSFTLNTIPSWRDRTWIIFLFVFGFMFVAVSP